ncbi:MAG TPA: hypothetical protein DEB06_01830 [Phycisphaerales bacterium]|nr:hypothetical protein [Phycisphaerales bacterium]
MAEISTRSAPRGASCAPSARRRTGPASVNPVENEPGASSPAAKSSESEATRRPAPSAPKYSRRKSPPGPRESTGAGRWSVIKGMSVPWRAAGAR